jgi:hypothetical protein
MITDPPPDDRPRPRPPHGLPATPPPGFIRLEGKAAILVYSDRAREWLRKRVRRRDGDAGG